MPRFFITGTPTSPWFLGGEEGSHGARSLRLRPGEEVTLCNGEGLDFPATVQRTENSGLWLQVGPPVPNPAEPATEITVCQCLPKGDKLETVVQKSVELGAVGIWQAESSRCVARPGPAQSAKKTARLQRIALEAAKQSGRGIIPQVQEPLPLRQALRMAAARGDVLFFYEKGRNSLKQALRTVGDRLFLFIGPEGGFSPEEAALAEELGARLLTLGPRILRTETAPLAALSAILYERGEMEL